jgi:hypothetical protein
VLLLLVQFSHVVSSDSATNGLAGPPFEPYLHDGTYVTVPQIPRAWVPLPCSFYGPYTFYWPDRLMWADWGTAHAQILVCGRTGQTDGFGEYRYKVLYWNTRDGYHDVTSTDERPACQRQTAATGEPALIRTFIFHHLGRRDPLNPYGPGGKKDLTAGIEDIANQQDDAGFSPPYREREVNTIRFLSTCDIYAEGYWQADPVDPFAQGVVPATRQAPRTPAAWIPQGCTLFGKEPDPAMEGYPNPPWVTRPIGYAYYSTGDPGYYVQLLRCGDGLHFLYVDGGYYELSPPVIKGCDYKFGLVYYSSPVGLGDPSYPDQAGGSLTVTAEFPDGDGSQIADEVAYETQSVQRLCK